MTTVGVRELRDRLSKYLSRVKAGERFIVTERGRPVAVLSAPPEGPVRREIEAMLREGLARWGGGKPRVAVHPPKNIGAPVAGAVTEDRG